MGWLRSLVRLLSLRCADSPPSSTTTTSTVVSGRSCLYSCNAMAPITRLRARENAREMELAKAEKAKRDKPSLRGSKRERRSEHTSSEPACKRENRGSEDASNCDICKASHARDSFVTGCKHTFCRSCLAEHVEKNMNAQMAVTQLTFQNLLSQIFCPNLSCEEELSRSELVDLLGPNQVKMYERWLVSIFDKLYRPSLMNSRVECTNSKCANQATPTVILASKIPDLTATEVRHALEVRGAEKKCMKQSCVRELLKAIGLEEKERNKVVWLCITCDASWCAACGGQLPVIGCKSDRSKVHTHCQGKQRYEIYKSLVELDDACRVYTAGRQSPTKISSKAAGAANTIWADGTGYGGDYIENKHCSDNMQAAAKRVELELDNQVEKQLVFLTSVLNGDIYGSNRRSLTAATCALIGWENILSRLLRQLATNDSMLDISERSSLYLKMVYLLKAIQMHAELLPLLLGCPNKDKLTEKEVWQGPLVDLAWGTSKGTASEQAVDTTDTVIHKMENIYRQAKVMLQNMPQLDGNSGADVDLSLARELCKCYEGLQLGISKLDSQAVRESLKDHPQGASTRSKAIKIESGEEDEKLNVSAALYKETLRKLQFQQLCMMDENGYYRHHYKDHISGKVANSACIDKRGSHNHKRMIHLSKEIASLATTLPLEWESSIHLCVDEARVDVLRALIIGPQGTPYQNGLFFFDIFLPPDYPQVPPLVHFLTTGGGKVRFNPNLYDSGKICLSLLGTWSGPGWVPGKSTLLQVLVSIQSLIFVKDPYYNEPGFEQSKSPEAEKENVRHREHTLSLAVLGALRKPDPLFADIMREHFRFKLEEVEQQCDQWVAATPDGYAKLRIANIAKDIKAELKNLRS